MSTRRFDAAARRAAYLQVGGDEVVRAHGLLPPDDIADALAEHPPPSADRCAYWRD